MVDHNVDIGCIHDDAKLNIDTGPLHVTVLYDARLDLIFYTGKVTTTLTQVMSEHLSYSAVQA